MVSCRVPSRPNLSARGQGVHGWPFKADMMYCAAATAAVANAREKASCLSAIMAVAVVEPFDIVRKLIPQSGQSVNFF